MTHQATANRCSLSARIVSVAAHILFYNHQRHRCSAFLFFGRTHRRTDTTRENNYHLFGCILEGQYELDFHVIMLSILKWQDQMHNERKRFSVIFIIISLLNFQLFHLMIGRLDHLDLRVYGTVTTPQSMSKRQRQLKNDLLKSHFLHLTDNGTLKFLNTWILQATIKF